MPRPGGTAMPKLVEVTGVERRREAVDDAEDPDERDDADEQRHRHEEPGDEAAAQPLHHPRTHPPATAAISNRPMAIRYQANGANPDRRTNPRNGLMTSSDEQNAIRKPTAISAPAIGRQLLPDLEQLVAQTPPSSSASRGRTRTPRPPAGRAASASRRRSSRPSATRRGRAPASGTRRCRTRCSSGVRSASRTSGSGGTARRPA